MGNCASNPDHAMAAKLVREGIQKLDAGKVSEAKAIFTEATWARIVW